MVESVILLLIQICLVVGLCWLVIWVLGKLGVELPGRVIQIFWVIVVLIVLLLLYRALSPLFGGRLFRAAIDILPYYRLDIPS